MSDRPTGDRLMDHVPSGWFRVCGVEEISKDGPHTFERFGIRLAVTLDAACEPSVRVLATEDAAGCPHCACGELGNIPYKRGRVLPACTRAGIVLAWYDHGGLKPAWVPSPVEWDPTLLIDAVSLRSVFDSTPETVLLNYVDMRHFPLSPWQHSAPSGCGQLLWSLHRGGDLPRRTQR